MRQNKIDSSSKRTALAQKLHEKTAQESAEKIVLLQKEVEQKKAVLRTEAIDANKKKALLAEIMDLNEQIYDLVSRYMPETIKPASKALQQRFEISEGIISPHEKSAE